MSSVQVRPFRRADREQLTVLVNAHVQAVVPGVSVSVNTVMSQLERDPGEFIVDPWVAERSTLVAEQRGRVVAAAHLLRYGTGAEVGETIRGAGRSTGCCTGRRRATGRTRQPRPRPSWRPAWTSSGAGR
jgi:hypothetical protein